MGKNSVIKSLARCIGNVVLHKLIVKHTNKPESKNYLINEIVEYGADAFEKAQMFNWNEKDKEKIKELSLKRINNLMRNYPDIEHGNSEVEELIEDTIDDLILL